MGDHEYGTFGVYSGADISRRIVWRTHNGEPYSKQYVISMTGSHCKVYSIAGRPLCEADLTKGDAQFEESTDEEACDVLDRIYTVLPVEMRETLNIDEVESLIFDILDVLIKDREVSDKMDDDYWLIGRIRSILPRPPQEEAEAEAEEDLAAVMSGLNIDNDDAETLIMDSDYEYDDQEEME